MVHARVHSLHAERRPGAPETRNLGSGAGHSAFLPGGPPPPPPPPGHPVHCPHVRSILHGGFAAVRKPATRRCARTHLNLKQAPVQSCVRRPPRLQAFKAAEAAKKARELVRRKGVLTKSTLPGKLADCSSSNKEECEIFLVEGDSAGGHGFWACRATPGVGAAFGRAGPLHEWACGLGAQGHSGSGHVCIWWRATPRVGALRPLPGTLPGSWPTRCFFLCVAHAAPI